MATLTFIPNTKTPSTPAGLSLDQISDEVKTDVEEVYKALKENPDGRIQVEFPSVGELNGYIKQVKAYCDLRPGGPIRFRQSPTPKQSAKNPNGLKPTQMEFRITDKTENETVTEEIREATVTANAASAKGSK